jgi:hypothetical protein
MKIGIAYSFIVNKVVDIDLEEIANGRLFEDLSDTILNHLGCDTNKYLTIEDDDVADRKSLCLDDSSIFTDDNGEELEYDEEFIMQELIKLKYNNN